MSNTTHATETLRCRFHTDPGHGWLEVPRAMLDQLGVADVISSYSYQSGDQIYLEEDCDANVFAAVCERAGITLDVTDKHTSRDSIIRKMQSYVA